MESIFFPGNVLCTRFEMQARVKKENSIDKLNITLFFI